MPGWIDVNALTDDQLAEKILTGCGGVKGFTPDLFVIQTLLEDGPVDAVLDFGCGMGRNIVGLMNTCPTATVVGYDSPVMLNRAARYLSGFDFNNRQPGLSANWDVIRTMSFDCILAGLVFQHIPEEELRGYLRDMACMTTRLIAYGRRYNDDGRKNTWKIVREFFAIERDPAGDFTLDGPPDDHHLLVLTPLVLTPRAEAP